MVWILHWAEGVGAHSTKPRSRRGFALPLVGDRSVFPGFRYLFFFFFLSERGVAGRGKFQRFQKCCLVVGSS